MNALDITFLSLSINSVTSSVLNPGFYEWSIMKENDFLSKEIYFIIYDLLFLHTFHLWFAFVDWLFCMFQMY